MMDMFQSKFWPRMDFVGQVEKLDADYERLMDAYSESPQGANPHVRQFMRSVEEKHKGVRSSRYRTRLRCRPRRLEPPLALATPGPRFPWMQRTKDHGPLFSASNPKCTWFIARADAFRDHLTKYLNPTRKSNRAVKQVPTGGRPRKAWSDSSAGWTRRCCAASRSGCASTTSASPCTIYTVGARPARLGSATVTVAVAVAKKVLSASLD